MITVAQTSLLDRHLLDIHHAIAFLFAPAMRTALPVVLIAFAGRRLHLFFHHHVPQLQAGRTVQVADAFLQQSTMSACFLATSPRLFASRFESRLLSTN